MRRNGEELKRGKSERSDELLCPPQLKNYPFVFVFALLAHAGHASIQLA